jgi:repressor LexA
LRRLETRYTSVSMSLFPFACRRSLSPDPLPLLGEIVAGRPGAAEGCTEACVPVSFDVLEIQKNARCFVLKVKGDSMSGAHIVDGDLVVLELRPPHDGAIAAALIDG